MTLDTAREQVSVSQETLDLAFKELRLSEKAFSIGTLTHLEVLNAQNSVSEARDRAIEALFNFTAARINLARAQGQVDKIYDKKGNYQNAKVFKDGRVSPPDAKLPKDVIDKAKNLLPAALLFLGDLLDPFAAEALEMDSCIGSDGNVYYEDEIGYHTLCEKDPCENM